MHLACKIYLWSFIALMKITYIIRTSSKFTYFAFLLVLNPYAFQSENESSKRGIGLQVPIVCHKCLDAELQNIQSCLLVLDMRKNLFGLLFVFKLVCTSDHAARYCHFFSLWKTTSGFTISVKNSKEDYTCTWIVTVSDCEMCKHL